jgi:hypothetical protein
MNPDRRGVGAHARITKMKDGARREKDYAILMTLPPNPLGVCRSYKSADGILKPFTSGSKYRCGEKKPRRPILTGAKEREDRKGKA